MRHGQYGGERAVPFLAGLQGIALCMQKNHAWGTHAPTAALSCPAPLGTGHGSSSLCSAMLGSAQPGTFAIILLAALAHLPAPGGLVLPCTAFPSSEGKVPGQGVLGQQWQYTVGREMHSPPESLPALEEQASTEPPRQGWAPREARPWHGSKLSCHCMGESILKYTTKRQKFKCQV